MLYDMYTGLYVNALRTSEYISTNYDGFGIATIDTSVLPMCGVFCVYVNGERAKEFPIICGPEYAEAPKEYVQRLLSDDKFAKSELPELFI